MELHLKSGAHFKIDNWTGHPIYSDIYVAELDSGKQLVFTVDSLNYIED